MTETILFVFFSLLFSVHSLFSFCLAKPFPLFLFLLQLCSILNTHIRSGCLAYFLIFRRVDYFWSSLYPPDHLCFFLSNNLWSFCLPGTCFFFFFSLPFFLSFCPVLSLRDSFIYYMSCRLGWNGLICFDLRWSPRESPPLCTPPHPHCLRMIFPIYLQSLIWIDPIYQGLYNSLSSSKMNSVNLNFLKSPQVTPIVAKQLRKGL